MENNDLKSEKRSKSLMGKVRLFFKKDYFQNKTVVWLLMMNLAANLADWLALAIFIRPRESNIILHYNVYFGVDMMGSWKYVFVLPSIGMTLFLVNFLLSMYFYENKERIASHILLIAALMAQLSLLIASLSVIIINY